MLGDFFGLSFASCFYQWTTLADGTWWIYYGLPWLQTLTLIATGVFAVIYTRATVKQLEIARRTLESVLREQKTAYDPFFLFPPEERPGLPEFRGGSQIEWQVPVTNVGANVYAVQVVSLNPNIQTWLRIPNSYFATTKPGDKPSVLVVKTSAPWPAQWSFAIRFTTRLNQRDCHGVYHVAGKEIRYEEGGADFKARCLQAP